MSWLSRRAALDRRQALALLARGGALLIVGCGTALEAPVCALAPALTAGPYWRDAALHRSDLRWDSQPISGAGPVSGIPLVLTLRVTTADERCRPLRGAQIDLWHCDARGVYSGDADRGTGGRDFLRGYQITDGAGEVRFRTVYPGWYPGRTVHVHAKVRLFDPFGVVSTEVNTQLFFDDRVTDSVLETVPYADRGGRDTRNADDPVLRGRDGPLVSVGGSPGSELQGSVDLGIRAGQIDRL